MSTRKKIESFNPKIKKRKYTLFSIQVDQGRHAFHIHVSKCIRLSKLPSKLPVHLAHMENRVARLVFDLFVFLRILPFVNFQDGKPIPLHRM